MSVVYHLKGVVKSRAVNGQDTLSDLRKRHIGYVLQTGGLLPYLTVGENIGLSRRLLGLPADGTVEKKKRGRSDLFRCIIVI